jgi:hypothetical protein
MRRALEGLFSRLIVKKSSSLAPRRLHLSVCLAQTASRDDTPRYWAALTYPQPFSLGALGVDSSAKCTIDAAEERAASVAQK